MTTGASDGGAGAASAAGAGGAAGGAAAAGAAAGQAAGSAVDALFGGAGAAGAGAPGAAGAAGGDPATGAQGGPAWWESDAFKLSTEKADPEKLSDAEWVANKKFGSFAELVKANRELEAKIGEKGLILPKTPEDPAWSDVYKALGRPDDPKGYDIPLPEGDDGAFADQFRPVAHKLGLNGEQVKGLAEWFNGLADQSAALNAETARAELKQEWGAQFDAQLELAMRARNTFKLDAAAVEKIASGYGLAPTMKLLAELGRSVGEGGGLAPGKGDGFKASIETMRARKAEIISSAELRQKLQNGDAALKAEWDAINAAEAAELDKAGI